MATQAEITSRIISQLKTLDPSISAIIGTPERKISDTVAQVLAEAQVDVNMLNGAFDINAKFGSDLDNMLGIFGFGRQQATKATSYVEFKRATPATFDIPISAGTQLKAPAANNGNDVAFITTRSVTLPAGSTMVMAPVEAVVSGASGNVPANLITSWNQPAISGIDSFTNPTPSVGGVYAETDSAVKARFQTAGPFRNLSGTKDQYLALALGTKSTKANVIGPISHYKEYIQVPSKPDNNGGNGTSGSEYTTSLSTNVNSKHFYDDLAKFVSDDTTNVPTIYNENFDFVVNGTPSLKNKGDAYRDYLDGTNVYPSSTTSPTAYQPNVTFKNVYTGSDDTIKTIGLNNVLLFEHYYISNASRNDYERAILNCVDVYVNESDKMLATAVIPRPGNDVAIQTFDGSDQYSAFYYKNYRRINYPTQPPIPGNIFIALPHQPVVDLPDTISVAAGTFIKNVHYWAVEDRTSLYGTVRARNGIEFSINTLAQSSQDNNVGPYTGPKITDYSGNQASLILSIDKTQKTIVVDSTSFDKLFYSGTIIIDDEEITYAKNASTTWSSSNAYVSGTLNANIDSLTTTSVSIKMSSGTPKSSGGLLLIDNELISYTGYTGSSSPYTLSNVKRGVNGTTPASHTGDSSGTGATMGETVIYNNKYYQAKAYISANTSTVPSSSSNWNLIGSVLAVTTDGRGSNMTIADDHTAGTSNATTPFTTQDNLLSIENYIYDANIYNLQSSLEGAKQITTDVLAHKAKIRYFKPDVTVMYSQGSNPSSVNSSIISSLKSYFDSQYFGTTIQLSDILQTIHNVAGVDNVRWSKDQLEAKGLLVDTDYNPRNRISETNVYGESPKVVLQQTKISDRTNPTTYKFYLSAGVDTITNLTVSGSASSTTAVLNSTTGLKPNTEYTISSTNISGTSKNISFKTGSLTSSDTNLVTSGANIGNYTITLSESSVASGTFTNETCTITTLLRGQLSFDYKGQTYSIKLDNGANNGKQLTVTNLNNLIGGFVTVTAQISGNENKFPTVDNPYIITYDNASDVEPLSIVNPEYISDYAWSYNSDFILGDDELAALPTGIVNSDGSINQEDVITIRSKAQNTWNKI